MNEAKLMWATPDGDNLIGYMARVSNSNATPDDPAEKLIRFLIQHKHWSPFDMVNMCIEIRTTRDIGRQVLRHWSIHPQEFSQRYATVDFSEVLPREMRLKGATNRQGSLEEREFVLEQGAMRIAEQAVMFYNQMIDMGVAPECARAILPEGYTPTRMYLNGTVRSWIHYLQQRLDSHAQKEHRQIAEQIAEIFLSTYPNIYRAAFGTI